MSRASSVDRLPEEIRAEIGKLRMHGCTIDQILAKLRELTPEVPSRSALGRHILKMDMLGEKIRRSREVATALVRELGDAPESQAARLNIEMLHSAMLDLNLAFAEDPEDGDISPTGVAALRGDPEGIMMLAKALESLGRASKTNVEFTSLVEKRAEERGRRKAAEAVDVVAKQRGLSADTVAAIRQQIFGVAA